MKITDVKRWRSIVIRVGSGEVDPGMITNKNGEYVAYEDYAALEAKCDALVSENVALKVLADACSREYESPKTEACEDDEKVAYPEEACNITFGMIRNAARTPATEAYLNSVRAEGAEAVEQKLLRMCAVAQRSDKEVIHALSIKAGEIANQLRAGEPS